MPFVYRLQKILDFRIRKKEEQLLALQRAQKELAIVEQKIDANNREIEQIKFNQKKADYKMMEYYDKYLHHLWEKAEKLELERQDAQRKVQEEMEKLVELEKAVKVLEKHKEKNKEAYLEEEKKIEIKQLSEIGVQKFFQRSRSQKEDEEYEKLLKELNITESELLDEY